MIGRIKIEGMQINGYQVYSKENIENAVISGVKADATWTLLKIIKF